MERSAVDSDSLCETKVLASRGHGSVHLLSESFIALVFGEIKLCKRKVSGWVRV